MKHTLAVCISSRNDLENVKKLIQSNNTEFDITFFVFDAGTDVYYNLWKTSVLKRDYEISNLRDFDVCSVLATVDHTIVNNFVIPLTRAKSRLYFYQGAVSRKLLINIPLDMFYADSVTFDRAAEFGVHYDIHRMRQHFAGMSVGATFYAHLKSTMITTECINFENSNLFIRPATVN